MEKIGRDDVEDFMAEKLADGRASKSVRDYVGLPHSLFAYAERQEWTRGNPCKLVERPGEDEGDADIRFLDQHEREVRFHDLRHTFGTRMARRAWRRAFCRSGWARGTSRPP